VVSSGYSESVRYGNEQTYSKATACNRDLGAVQSISPSEKNNLIKIRTLGGNRDYKTVIPGKFEISGSMEYLFQGGDFLRQCIGEDTATTATVDSGPKYYSTAVTGTAYLHVLGSANSPGVNSYPSFTLEFTDYEDAGTATTTANLKRTYAGCRVNSLTMSASIDEPLKCAIDWMAKKVVVSTGAATSVTEYTADPYVFYEGHVFLSTGAITSETTQADLHTDALCLVNNFDLTVNNNLEAGWYIAGTCSAYDSARAAKFIIPKGRDYSLKLGLHYSDKDMYQRFLGAAGATTDQESITKSQIVLDFVRTGTIGTKLSTNRYIRMVMSSASFDDIAINGAPEDIVSNDVTVFGKNVTWYVVDDTSSYSS